MNTITVSEIQNRLANGETREDIREAYGLTHKELKHLFSHPKLKGLKTKKPFSPSFEIQDDTAEENTAEAPMEQESDYNH